jgi:hypothetical protein
MFVRRFNGFHVFQDHQRESFFKRELTVSYSSALLKQYN